MKLNHFTDFSMRVLIYLNDQKHQSSLDDLANTFKISRNHLIKVIQFLVKNRLVITKRGKNGGITIANRTKEIPLGDLIHLLEQDSSPIINCNSKPCIFQPYQCKLKYFFDKAYQSFIESLNENTLDDLVFTHWKELASNIKDH